MNNEIFKKEKLMLIITAVISGLVIMYAFVEYKKPSIVIRLSKVIF